MEDKPKPVTTNKNGRPRKVLDENALQKLAQAREIARKMANERTIEKTQAKLEKEKSKFKPEEEAKEEVEPVKEENPVDLIEDEKPTDTEVIESEDTEVKPVKKEKKKVNKKQPKVIVEQSSDDSDEFEENNRVIFVKRVSRKKKEEKKEEKEIKQEIQKVALPEYPGSPEQRRPPPEPRMTREQAHLQNSYNSMFSGGFLNNNNMRRRY